MRSQHQCLRWNLSLLSFIWIYLEAESFPNSCTSVSMSVFVLKKGRENERRVIYLFKMFIRQLFTIHSFPWLKHGHTEIKLDLITVFTLCRLVKISRMRTLFARRSWFIAGCCWRSCSLWRATLSTMKARMVGARCCSACQPIDDVVRLISAAQLRHMHLVSR